MYVWVRICERPSATVLVPWIWAVILSQISAVKRPHFGQARSRICRIVLFTRREKSSHLLHKESMCLINISKIFNAS